ncbi:excinuclease ABC subunit UvrC [Candidatus Peregrinibacteria bacterium]|nr:excinuclease ABC subunit UvrC [Candidatus Peregrinibacteria bacterium]
MDHLRHLRSRLAIVPHVCGVYRWIDEKGDILYVGKAKDLRSRLRSYLSTKEKPASPWKRSLQEKIRDFETTLTRSELEALILETNLIKELRPKYNVLMKDDKNYTYIHVSTDEDYPRISTMRKIIGDRGKYFGPFIKTWEVKEMLEMLHELWGWRACGKIGKDHPCLEYQIGKCNGLCIGKISQEEYRSRIEKVMRFLRGDHREAMTRLRECMQEAAIQKQFERAARYRDILGRLKTKEKQIVSDTSRENADVLGVAVHHNKAQVVLLHERSGRLINELSFILVGKFETESSVITQFIQQYYSDSPDIPDVIVCGTEVMDKNMLEDWLRRKRGGTRVRIHIPRRGKKSKLLNMAEFNAEQKVQQQNAKWEAEAANLKEALKELQEILSLKRAPRRIEGYDTSHLGGTETVGSMVVFKNGKPANDEYRSFTIRTLRSGDIDDYAALKEVLQRRLIYLSNKTYREELDGKKKKPDVSLISAPDLLVVDGGKGQLSTAASVLKELQIDIPVIALAKREEEVFRLDDSLPVPFPADSPAVFLLMRLRDESHRRAHQHQEKRHLRRTINN